MKWATLVVLLCIYIIIPRLNSRHFEKNIFEFFNFKLFLLSIIRLTYIIAAKIVQYSDMGDDSELEEEELELQE